MPGAIHRASSDSKSCKRRQSVVGLSTLDIFSCQIILPHTFLLLNILRRRRIVLMIIVMIMVMMIKMIVMMMRWWWLRWWWSIFYIHLIAASHHSISVTRFIPWIFTVKRSLLLKSLWISAHCTSQKKSSNLTSHFKTIGNSYYHYIITYSSWFSH